ncbi:MAG: hypothetical protein KGP14_01825 [Betaproteobacteria bacterium]|nr:hypothetical protein [Betaproteobacteria bacterium]
MSNNPLNPDQSTQTVPPATAGTVSPTYPRAMYHPTNGQTFVADSTQEAALFASDNQWSEMDPFVTT